MLISPKFDLHSMRVLHLEPTTVCNLGCPLCVRTDINDYNKTNPRLELTTITIEQLSQALPTSVVAGLDKMFMCGNLGDPAAAQNCLEIYQWFRKQNTSIVLGINSNGSLRSQRWWQLLADVLNQPKDYAVFSIDGLEDTNHIYRIRSDWKKLMSNAQAFIDAGGQAHWDMLVYEHNEHQVDACAELARSMGFKWFRAKHSKREIPVYLSKRIRSNTVFDDAAISTRPEACPHDQEQMMYMDAQARIWTCCHVATAWNKDTDEGKALRTQFTDYTEIMPYIQNNWDNHILTACRQNCSSTTHGPANRAQWRLDLELK